MTNDRKSQPSAPPEGGENATPPRTTNEGEATAPDRGHETGGGHDGMGPGPTGS